MHTIALTYTLNTYPLLASNFRTTCYLSFSTWATKVLILIFAFSFSLIRIRSFSLSHSLSTNLLFFSSLYICCPFLTVLLQNSQGLVVSFVAIESILMVPLNYIWFYDLAFFSKLELNGTPSFHYVRNVL